MVDKKQKYNELLQRVLKGTMFLDSKAPETEKEKWQGEYIKLLQEINLMVAEFIASGERMTKDIILGGFQID